MEKEESLPIGGPEDGAGLIIEREYYDKDSFFRAIEALETLDLNYEVERTLDLVDSTAGLTMRRTYRITILTKEDL